MSSSGRSSRVRMRVARVGAVGVIAVLAISTVNLFFADSTEKVLRAAVFEAVPLAAYAFGADSGTLCVSVESPRGVSRSDRSQSDPPSSVLVGVDARANVLVRSMSQCVLVVRDSTDVSSPTRFRESRTARPAAIAWIERSSRTRVRIGIEGGAEIGGTHECRALPLISRWLVVGCTATRIL